MLREGKEGADARDASSRSSCVWECPMCRVFLISAQRLPVMAMASESRVTRSDISYLPPVVRESFSLRFDRDSVPRSFFLRSRVGFKELIANEGMDDAMRNLLEIIRNEMRSPIDAKCALHKIARKCVLSYQPTKMALLWRKKQNMR
jgi:hypothetical protein